jgi:hypothetical protein
MAATQNPKDDECISLEEACKGDLAEVARHIRMLHEHLDALQLRVFNLECEALRRGHPTNPNLSAVDNKM